MGSFIVNMSKILLATSLMLCLSTGLGWAQKSSCEECHGKAKVDFQKSIHKERGIACVNCHGGNPLDMTRGSMSKENGFLGAINKKDIPDLCAKCHESESLQTQYGLLPRRLATYYYSFHGISLKYGQVRVANCSSCHGYHDILPSTDPRSSISKENLATTCGKCHPGAGENFARGKIHIEATPESSLGVYIVRKFYYWFIGILVLGFVIHVTLDLIGRRRRRAWRKNT